MDLPCVPVETRRAAIADLAAVTSLPFGRELESYCHANRCITGDLAGIPVWRYGDRMLFETDRPEDHVRAAGFAYALNVTRVRALLDLHTAWPSAADVWYADALVGQESPDYKKFTDKYHTAVARAKAVLAEKGFASGVGIFKCPRCKSKDVDTEQKQTRSADEPMTVFCSCTHCHTKWTIK